MGGIEWPCSAVGSSLETTVPYYCYTFRATKADWGKSWIMYNSVFNLSFGASARIEAGSVVLLWWCSCPREWTSTTCQQRQRNISVVQFCYSHFKLYEHWGEKDKSVQKGCPCLAVQHLTASQKHKPFQDRTCFSGESLPHVHLR